MLNMGVEIVEGRVPVTVLRLEGELDATNYEQLISRVEALYNEGARDLLLDLENVDFVSSSGLIGLHSAALIMRGETLADREEGWAAFRAVSRDMLKSSSQEAHFKLLNPQPVVRKVLDTSGFSDFMPVFEDEAAAIASFG